MGIFFLIGKLSLFRSIMELDGASNMDTRKRTCDGQRTVWILNSILWSRNIINKNKTIYNTIVENLVLYGAETLPINIHQKRMLLTGIDYWQRVARRAKMERVNHTVRHMTQVENLKIIEQQILMLCSHLGKMEEDRIIKTELEPEARS